MSTPDQSIVLSIKTLELPNQTTPTDNINCYFYLNSSPFSVAKISNPTNSTLISSKSPDDSLQLVFRHNNETEPIGSVSFRMNYFAQSTTSHFTRWITLFNDPVCDSFAGNIGGENSDRPRVFIDFDISKEEAFPNHPELVSFEHYLKEKEQGGVGLPQINEELEMSDLRDSLDDQNYISVGLSSAVEAHNESTAQPGKVFQFDEDSVKAVSEDSKQSKYKPKQYSEGLVEALSSKDLNRNPKLKGDVELRKESKGEAVLEQQNALLTHKIMELNQRIQELENKNGALKESEDTSLTKLHHLKIEFEKLRFKTESYETLVNETEQELAEARDQLTVELAAKAELVKDKEGLTVSLKQAKEAYEELKNIVSVDQKESPTVVKEEVVSQEQQSGEAAAQANEQIRKYYEELIAQNEKEHSEEREALTIQNSLLKDDLQALKTKMQGDETIIQNLQKELTYLRQKDEENKYMGLSEKLREAEDKVRFYEEKTKSMIEVCAAYLFKDMNNFESIEDLIIRVKKEIDNNKQEMQELRTINEALELKLSICDNKLLADTLWGQINDFKHQVGSLEKERESQKNELFKVNENYTKLINKYTELTEVLATLQQPVQKSQPLQKTPQKQPPTMNNLNKNSYSKVSTRVAAETPDEIEAKLLEFTTINKISPSFLTKVEKGVYLYNGRKMYLKVMSGKLMVKGVAGYKPLQDFIRGEPCSGTRTPPRSAKEFPRSERKSFDGKLNRGNKLELGSAQVADHLRRDLTPDSVRSVSFSSKEGFKDFATPKDYDTRPLLTEPCFSETTKSRGNEQVRVKDLIASRSVERRISYNVSRSGQKSQRESLF